MSVNRIGCQKAAASGMGIRLPTMAAKQKSNSAPNPVLLLCTSFICIVAGVSSPSFSPLILGDIAFALGGAHSARKANAPWYISLISGLSTYSFGGGLIRDQLLLGKSPWFVDEFGQFVFVAGIILAFIFLYDLSKQLSDKWNNTREFASWILISCDSIGLVQFAQLGYNKMGAHAAIPLAIAGSLATMIGGGVLAIRFRSAYIPVKRALYHNRYYYVLAATLCFSCLIANFAGVDAKDALAILSLPSILAGLIIEKKHRELIKIWHYLKRLAASISTEWFDVMPSVIRYNYLASIRLKQFMDFINKQIKLVLNASALHNQGCDNFHRKQGLMA